LTIGSQNSPSTCSGGKVTLSAIASGGTTTPMTYTWTVGGTAYTTTNNSYTTGSLSSSAAYTVKVKNRNNCESNSASGSITVNSPGTNTQSSSPCGCASGTKDCSGTCKTITTYTVDGNCTGTCNVRNVTYYNECGITGTGTRADPTCQDGCCVENNFYTNGDCTNCTACCQPLCPSGQTVCWCQGGKSYAYCRCN
jgi:hypothetical protein